MRLIDRADVATGSTSESAPMNDEGRADGAGTAVISDRPRTGAPSTPNVRQDRPDPDEPTERGEERAKAPQDDERAKSDDDRKDNEDDGEANDDEANKPSFIRRHPIGVAIAVLLVVAVVVLGYFYWLIYLHPYESSDDAFIDARQFALAPQVGGYVTGVPVTDNQHVDKGQLLFQIDQSTYKAALDQALASQQASKAAIESSDAQIAGQRAQVEESKAMLQQAEAALDFARQDAKRYEQLAATGNGTVQQSQQSVSNLQQQQASALSARAAETAAERQVATLQAQKAQAIANLADAKAQVERAQLNLSFTTVNAPQPGRVTRLSGALGQLAQAGQSLSMFVPDDIWVTANFKETQITDMRAGQPVDVEIDAYPDHKIQGRVDSIQSGSGTAFSLLPAENATGNYIKVVQRVPVKIVVDHWPDDIVIGPGMSVVPTVTVRPR